MDCESCGATLSAEELLATSCRYCGAALKHAVRAAEHVGRDLTLDEAVAADALTTGMPSEEIHAKLASDPERSGRKLFILLGCIAVVILFPLVLAAVGIGLRLFADP